MTDLPVACGWRRTRSRSRRATSCGRGATAPTAVSIENVNKTFRIPHQQYSTLKERALHPFRRTEYDELHAVQDPAGAGAEAEVDDNGHDADAVVITSPKGAVIFELVTGGNANARAQFESMLRSLQIS